jgi:alpha-ketoglutarate-dependent taurine dioxygenase
MRPDAVLVNTARGGLGDQAALGRAIAAGRLAGAGLDVRGSEAPGPGGPLLRAERVIITPHIAFYSAESLAALKRRVAGLKIKHDGTYNSGGFLRQGVTPTDDPRTSAGAIHPLGCTHPDTGREMLYLGRRRNASLVGLELAESEALLDELWGYVERPVFAWEHVWQVGDLVIWDNRCTMHRRDPFDDNSRRIMHRTQIKGIVRPA